ncbi:MAG: hypothetical protein K0S56_1414 [Microvirga sp.]|jgi:hypothetical protein|nr:hypothetical protein [Microvirga sp.]
MTSLPMNFAPRPRLNIPKIEACILQLPRLLAGKFHDNYFVLSSRLPNYLFSNAQLKNIGVTRGTLHTVFEWTDLKSGKEGQGVVSLFAHLNKIDESEAAYRVARFLYHARGIGTHHFVVED